MLIIRKEQEQVFRKARWRDFEERLVEHVGRFFPNHMRVAGRETVANTVHFGVERGRSYGFDTERSLYLYTTVTFMLGSRFDEDPLYPWTADFLGPTAIGRPGQRAAALADRSLEFQEAVAGPQNRAINRVFLTINRDPTMLILPVEEGAETAIIEARLRALYPRKCELLDPIALSALVNRAVNGAMRYKMLRHGGVALYAYMTFLLGSHFDREPFLPWVQATLARTDLDEKSRVERLYSETVVFLSDFLRQEV